MPYANPEDARRRAKRRYADAEVKERIRKRSRDFYRNNKTKVSQRIFDNPTRARYLVTAARNRKRKGKFELTTAWALCRIEKGQCEATGIPFVLDCVGSPWSPSIDRIDNTKGYTRRNCRLVVWLYNAAKNKHDDADVLLLAEALCIREKR
jgi:hypothetical protein